MQRFYIALCTFVLLNFFYQTYADDYEYPDYYEYEDDPCDTGVNLTDTEGVVQSFEYPSFYFAGAFCTWSILSSADTKITVKFEPLFSVEFGSDGECGDYLEFDDGTHVTKLCGTGTPPSFMTSSNQLTVNFFTNENVEAEGFSFNWTVIDDTSIPSPVHETLTDSYGAIQSPNYPKSYDNLEMYTWHVTVESGKFIAVEFDLVFGMENGEGTNCPYDVLTVYNGNTAVSSNILKKVCSRPTDVWILESNEVLFEFSSDSSNTGAGFSLTYTTIEPATCDTPVFINATSGVISSPYYSVPYANDLNCEWHIGVAENQQIAVHFNSVFDIKYEDSCISDYLQIFDDPTTMSTQFQENFCGKIAPRSLLSSTNQLTIIFKSGSLPGNAVGFSFNWTAENSCNAGLFQCWDGSCIDETKKCDGTLDCPNDTADEAECGHMPGPNDCGKQEIAPTFTFDHRIIGGSEVTPGSWPWQAGILAPDNIICGGALISRDWVLTAAHCVPKGYQLNVVLGEHDTRVVNSTREQRISVDQFVIHPNFNHQSAKGYLEGSDIALLHLSQPANLTTWVQIICLPSFAANAGQTMIVTGWGRSSAINTEYSDVLRQVRLPVLSETQCNKSFTSLSDSQYPDDVICLGVDGTGAGACQGDSGGPVMHYKGARWELSGIISFSHECGAGQPTYVTDVDGFSSYIEPYLTNGIPEQVIKELVITASSGEITVPALEDASFPKYAQNTEYKWFITSPEDTRITVRFGDVFNIEFGGEFCPFDYLIVYDGVTTADEMYLNRKLCGSLAPPDFESTTNSIIIIFSTDNSFEESGFSITWDANDDCAPNEFRCWNQSCIKDSQKCDGVHDCVDSSDEIQCSLASTGSNECGKPEVAPTLPWYPLIVGGYNSVEGSWPWQVALFESSTNSFNCGGTLIDNKWVITAGHCINPDNEYTVTLDDHDLGYISLHQRRFTLKSMILHPDFRSFGIDDIALLELFGEVEFSKYIKPICLPAHNDVNPPVGTTCVLTGWGVTAMVADLTGPEILQQIQLTVLSDADCIDSFKLAIPGYAGPELPENIICAGHTNKRANACQRDSGSPLQCLINGSWKQYGLVSFGTLCGDHIFFEKISFYKNWIDSVQLRQKCDEQIIQEGMSGIVEVPTVNGKYSNDVSCSWLIRAPENYVVDIVFIYFDVEQFPTCTFDYVNIYDGGTEDSRKFLDETLCGENVTIPGFESSSNEVLVTFNSDDSEQKRGFKLTWTAVPDCQSDEFRCWDGSCIPASKKCDRVQDCPNDRDEIECTHPDHVCGSQSIAPEFLWSHRIVGGNYAVKGSWPWQVYLLDSSGAFQCGGTVVDKDWILTAAHCTYFGQITVGVGGHNLTDSGSDQIIPVTDVRRHLQYDNGKIGDGYDIALLRLSRSIVFGTYSQTICLSTPDNVPPISTDANCIVTGWGLTKTDGTVSQVLRQVRVPILSDAQCLKANGKAYNEDFLFCAGNIESGGVDSCQGDSGGPLVCLVNDYWYQYGVVSYGSAGKQCGTPDAAGFYTTVSYYEDWIRNETNGSLPVIPPDVTTTTQITNTTEQVTNHTSFSTTEEVTTPDQTHLTTSRTDITVTDQTHLTTSRTDITDQTTFLTTKRTNMNGSTVDSTTPKEETTSGATGLFGHISFQFCFLFSVFTHFTIR